ncbi:MAG TPA: D-2-hydroxyacid dehydrogenase [Bryobacteraceae bacterium]|nr:D-2-hydroxyacid dehydrogenase [Bryobacteraceae bacterium]
MPNEPLRIATTYHFEPEEIARLKTAVDGRPLEIALCRNPDEFRGSLATAEAIFGSCRAGDLAYAPRLKWIQFSSAGLDDVDAEFFHSPMLLTNYAGAFAPAIAETAFGMLLALARGLRQFYIPQFQRREWKPVGTPKSADHVEIAGRTMGIVGLGGIGRAVARTAAQGFQMRVVATDARRGECPDYVAELHEPGWFDELVRHSDVVVAAAPLTLETKKMFDERAFRNMKRSAYFLALSRGQLFDDMALVRALRENWIAGAGLDVFPPEPPPPEHPIFDCPNVVMSMHTSGWGPGRQFRLIELFCENLRRYTSGRELLNVVDKQRRY